MTNTCALPGCNTPVPETKKGKMPRTYCSTTCSRNAIRNRSGSGGFRDHRTFVANHE